MFTHSSTVAFGLSLWVNYSIIYSSLNPYHFQSLMLLWYCKFGMQRLGRPTFQLFFAPIRSQLVFDPGVENLSEGWCHVSSTAAGDFIIVREVTLIIWLWRGIKVRLMETQSTRTSTVWRRTLLVTLIVSIGRVPVIIHWHVFDLGDCASPENTWRLSLPVWLYRAPIRRDKSLCSVRLQSVMTNVFCEVARKCGEWTKPMFISYV